MGMTNEERIQDEAAAWLFRQQDAAMDWLAFTAWLEADPRHRGAFDELALLDVELGEGRSEIWPDQHGALPEAANDRASAPIGRWAGWVGGAMAATLAAVLVLQPGTNGPAIQNYHSGADKSAEIALNDGTKIVLAPASTLQVRGTDLALQGTGYFDVPHKAGRTLTVRAGDFVVNDIGTRFSVGNDAEGVRVEVADGSVAVSSSRLAKPVPLSAGHGLIADTAAGRVQLTTVEPAAVASWRSGKLTFDQAPLALVAREVSRYSGHKVTVDPAIADQAFSGVIAIDEGDSPGAALAQILALDAKPVDGGVRLEPRR
nr:FecR domain-containing protein [uncultured Sphingomonas sp.]